MSPRRWIALAAALTLGAALAPALYLLSAPGPAGAPPRAFEVPSGASAQQITQRLESEGLIRSRRAFLLLLRASGAAHGLRAGEFSLSASMSAGEVSDVLLRGLPLLHEVTVPEGFSARQIAARLAAAGLGGKERYGELLFSKEFAASLDVTADSLEGYLFPTTYAFAKPVSEKAVVQKMVATLREQLPAGYGETLKARGLKSLHELLTLASIVEKETGVAAERPLIASVFLNRLARGMRLETDPAVIYGLGEAFDGNLRRSDLSRLTPYNTYLIPGLPPGPIASPGLESIRAVLEPARSEYLFFVARRDGTHHFSVTFEEHTQAVRHYQLGRGAAPKEPPR